MTLLAAIIADLLNSIYGYWHVWLYAGALIGFYIYFRTSQRQEYKTAQNTNRVSGSSRHRATITDIAPVANRLAAAYSAEPLIAELHNAEPGINESRANAGPHSSNKQWQALSSIVDQAMTRAGKIDSLQHEAGVKLGATELNLNDLLTELAAIMPLPIEPTRPGMTLSAPLQRNTIAQDQALAA